MPNVTEKAMHDAATRHSADRRQVMRIAIQLIERRRQEFAAYDADVARWYQHRHINQGLAYPVCIHGVSRYYDYDCACGACEDGDGYFDYLRVAREALYEAQLRWDNYWKAQHAYITMISLGYDAEKAGQFSQWAHNRYLVVK